MMRKTLVIAVMVLAIGALLFSVALAGNGKMQGKKAQQTQQVRKGNAGECPNGNTPQGKAQGTARGNGPGDCTGNGGDGPKDGTGYGKTKNPNATGECDGTGPKGKTTKVQAAKRNGRQR